MVYAAMLPCRLLCLMIKSLKMTKRKSLKIEYEFLLFDDKNVYVYAMIYKDDKIGKRNLRRRYA